jgi:hypothetical protein
MKATEEQLIEVVRFNKGGETWWMSDFYEDFCKLYSLDFNEVAKNTIKIRYELNKLYKKGLLTKKRYGTEYGGKELYNSTYFVSWELITE